MSRWFQQNNKQVGRAGVPNRHPDEPRLKAGCALAFPPYTYMRKLFFKDKDFQLRT